MPDTITITLAGKPVGKGRPRFSRKSGHAYTPAATRDFENSLRGAGQMVMAGRDLIEGPVEVEVTAYMPIPTSWSRKKQEAAADGLILPMTTPDADNLLKMLDALNEVVWRDDKQIADAVVRKRYSRKPSLRVEISEIVAEQPKPTRTAASAQQELWG